MGVQYIVYRTVNAVNGKFYIGVHKDHGRADSYLGSGKYIKAAVKKYGRVNFSRETIAFFRSAGEAFEEEKKLLAGLIGDPLCMNVHEGGCGGFDYIISNGLHRPWTAAARALGAAKIKQLAAQDCDWREHRSSRIKAGMEDAAAQVPNWTARRMRGVLGSKWATNGVERVKIKPGGKAPEGWTVGSTGCRWATNGTSTKRFKPSEEIPEGWTLGRTIPDEKKRPKSKHGTYSCYVMGCRCTDCTNANRLYTNQLRRRKKDRAKTMTY